MRIDSLNLTILLSDRPTHDAPTGVSSISVSPTSITRHFHTRYSSWPSTGMAGRTGLESSLKPDLDLRGPDFEACAMNLTCFEVVPLPRPAALLRTIRNEDEFALGDHTAVLSVVRVVRDLGARWIGCE